MKKLSDFILSHKAFIVMIISFVMGLWLSDYFFVYRGKNGYRDVHGVVFEKIGEQKSHYKSTRIYTDFIMVIKDKDTGKYFDLKVSPTTFSLYEKGDNIFFSQISKNTIGEEYETKDYIIVIALICGLVFIICLSSCFVNIYE